MVHERSDSTDHYDIRQWISLVQAHNIGAHRPRFSGGNHGAVCASGKKNRDDLTADKVRNPTDGGHRFRLMAGSQTD